jgi:hypothetical protein
MGVYGVSPAMPLWRDAPSIPRVEGAHFPELPKRWTPVVSLRPEIDESREEPQVSCPGTMQESGVSEVVLGPGLLPPPAQFTSWSPGRLGIYSQLDPNDNMS